MTLREELEGQVFMIAQALVASGKHTNRYELARDAVEIAKLVKDEIEKSIPDPWVLGEEKPEGWE
jgi:hypothetical protein